MFCGECGHRWAPEEIASARFCAECGAPREDPPPSPLPSSSAAAPTSGTTGAAHTMGAHVYGSPMMKPSLPIGGSALGLPQPTATATTTTAAIASTPLSMPPSGGGIHTTTSSSSSHSTSSCGQCHAPFPDSSAQFCGECGHPRPPTTTAGGPTPFALDDDGDDDGDLFGTASTTHVPPGPTHAPGVSMAPGVAPSVSVGFEPRGLAPLAPAPAPMAAAAAAAAPPPVSAMAPSPPASITLNPSAGTNHISALLANLSVAATPAGAEREEPSGSGAGIVVRSVQRARDMDALGTRLAISRAVEANRAQPQERVEGYHQTRVSDAITVLQSERIEAPAEDRYYDARTLPDDAQWLGRLRDLRQHGTKFTDPQFPADASSLYRDPNNKRFPHLDEHVWKWKRISEFFNETAYVEITMVDDPQRLVCAIAMKSAAEAESILQILQQQPSPPVDPAFYQRATDAVTTGLAKRRRDHLLLCTKNMITHLSEHVQDGGIQRFDLLWDQSLLERYRPLSFAGVGDGSAYRLDGSEAGMVSRISVLVPVFFRAQGTCLFDRSRERGPQPISGVGIAPGALRLGRLADAYLFGALSILSTSPTALAQVFPLLEPDLVRPERVEPHTPYPNEQQYNEEGLYAVRFWRSNRSRVVVIDDYIPCNQYGKPVFGSFTGGDGKFEIWSVLIEKAYAKLHGAYEAIIGGQEAYALQDLYGGVPVTRKLQDAGATEEDAWAAVSRALRAGSLVGVTNDSVNPELPRGLQPSAAYGILGLVELDHHGERVRLVQLRNSWGVDEWSGAWARSDPKWHGLSRAQKIECGFQFREDRTYWMDFGALCCFFTTLIESRNLYNFTSVGDQVGNPEAPSLSVHIVTGEWSGLTSGGREAMHLNPQYQLFAPALAGCHVTLHLEQPSRRMQNATEYEAYIAPAVFRNGDKGQRKLDLAPDVVATGTRPLVVVPATYDRLAAPPLGYSLTVFSTKPTALVPISDASSLPICCVCTKALAGAFKTFTMTSSTGATQLDRVCNDCVGAYRDRHTPTCAHCQERIEQVPGRFSGRLFTLPEGPTVHAECIDAYRIRIADKCVQCGDAIAAIPGRFDGTFFVLPDATGSGGSGKCHAECLEAYQRSTAKRCRQCHEPVVKLAGRFDGRFYKLPDEELVHFECWDAYQQALAPKCVHCHAAIVQLPGRFDGRFYDLTSGLGKVHFECWEAYQAALLRG